MIGLAARPLRRMGGDLLLVLLPVLVRRVQFVGLLVADRLQAVKMRIVRRGTEDPLIAQQIVGSGFEDVPVKTGGQARQQVRRFLPQRRQQRLDLPQCRRHLVCGWPASLAGCAAAAAASSLASGRFVFAAPPAWSAAARRERRHRCGSETAPPSAPAGAPPSAVASSPRRERHRLPIRLQAAQQQFPFEKRRTQADALQRLPRRLVLAGLDLPESEDDAIEVVACSAGGRAARPAASCCIGGVGDAAQQPVAAAGSVSPLDQRQRPSDFAALGPFPRPSAPARPASSRRDATATSRTVSASRVCPWLRSCRARPR